MTSGARPRLVVGITGATGAAYGVQLIRRARMLGAETHLILSPAGVLNAHHELGMGRDALEREADRSYAPGDVGACVASGSFRTAAMVVAPCSMRTLAAIANGLSDNLMTRAADVTLKERRRLILMVRETPFNLAHLRNMTSVTEMGGIIFPPLPALYLKPQSIDEMVAETVERVLEMAQLPGAEPQSWQGLRPSSTS
ncbi:UbiX family flavin prenyltransferase [Roseateles amylovorans]|uniref:Flavin prenyltransferase UbiX n=1 Tax=Roseateles amylovorans TaxID=2978473 RepID=A0ABY6B2L1_9BURK|nr:UbiX family flavin prenyltransferase [Roseateles amylovorans]UXH77763.1 UbiX family flavin prenyltransferase [Roseateles amylovorans]